jgi:hypothetical protein
MMIDVHFGSNHVCSFYDIFFPLRFYAKTKNYIVLCFSMSGTINIKVFCKDIQIIFAIDWLGSSKEGDSWNITQSEALMTPVSHVWSSIGIKYQHSVDISEEIFQSSLVQYL